MNKELSWRISPVCGLRSCTMVTSFFAALTNDNRRFRHPRPLPWNIESRYTTDHEGEVLGLLENWRGASFAEVNQQTGFGEPGKGAPHGNENTGFAAYT